MRRGDKALPRVRSPLISASAIMGQMIHFNLAISPEGVGTGSAGMGPARECAAQRWARCLGPGGSSPFLIPKPLGYRAPPHLSPSLRLPDTFLQRLSPQHSVPASEDHNTKNTTPTLTATPIYSFSCVLDTGLQWAVALILESSPAPPWPPPPSALALFCSKMEPACLHVMD